MVLLEAISYIVTILGFPTAIIVFIYEERKRRENDEHELHRNLTEEYDNFLKLVLENADLLLLRRSKPSQDFSEEQLERKEIIFRMLISLFEKAFIILYDEKLSRDARRRWLSWEDDMREWCRREDFRAVLPHFLEGEDEAFSHHIQAIASEEAAAAGG